MNFLQNMKLFILMSSVVASSSTISMNNSDRDAKLFLTGIGIAAAGFALFLTYKQFCPKLPRLTTTISIQKHETDKFISNSNHRTQGYQNSLANNNSQNNNNRR